MFCGTVDYKQTSVQIAFFNLQIHAFVLDVRAWFWLSAKNVGNGDMLNKKENTLYFSPLCYKIFNHSFLLQFKVSCEFYENAIPINTCRLVIAHEQWLINNNDHCPFTNNRIDLILHDIPLMPTKPTQIMTLSEITNVHFHLLFSPWTLTAINKSCVNNGAVVCFS